MNIISFFAYRLVILSHRKSLSESSKDSPKPPGRTGMVTVILDERLLTIFRPIPQWFRLKSDTKIQVRRVDS